MSKFYVKLAQLCNVNHIGKLILKPNLTFFQKQMSCNSKYNIPDLCDMMNRMGKLITASYKTKLNIFVLLHISVDMLWFSYKTFCTLRFN